MIYTILIHGNINERMQNYVSTQLEIAKRTSKVKGIILEINSGGGSASASEMIYDRIQRANRVKPVIAIVTGTAASGAYMIACGAKMIFSINTGIVGSVGVISMSPDLTGMIEKIGVKMNIVSLGEKKSSMNPFESPTEESLNEQKSMLKEVYDFFIKVVRENRHLSDEEIEEVGKSGVYTPLRARALHLIDEVDSYGVLIGKAKMVIGDQSDPVILQRKQPFLIKLIMNFLGR